MPIINDLELPIRGVKLDGPAVRAIAAHNAKDGWRPLTNDPTWPSNATAPQQATNIPIDYDRLAGLCPKPSEPEMPSVSPSVFVSGVNPGRDILRLESAVVKLQTLFERLLAIVEKLGVRVDALESLPRYPVNGLRPFATIPDGEEDCE